MRISRLFYLIIILFCCASINVFSQQNDHIFPPADAAKSFINYDGQGFIINGKKTYLVSAGVEYARIPHQLWYDRLLRLKRAGFNCIEMYTFWDFHEPHEGQFDFAGDHDLDAFLKLIKKLDMYAIVRVGPYYCAEWSFGGYPIWLHFKNNMVVREPNAEFEKYADRFFDKLIPIVSNNQINHGGSVVMVQLENEHSAGWGTLEPNEYFTHLRKKALSLGLQVPYFFSGLHHGADPAGNGTHAFDNSNRPNPWFTTEFWTVWYNFYGSSQKDADQFGRRTWKIIEHGGGGYNYYMAHGGTNFGYSNNDEDAASYDYGAAVGQTGDLRPIYYQFKANALFARSFESILSNAVDATANYKNILADTGVRVYARHSENGDIAFLDNPNKNEATVQVNISDHQLPEVGIKLAAEEIMPVIKGFKLTPQITIDYAITRVLGLSKQGNTYTLVAYGPTGSNAEIKLSANAPFQTKLDKPSAVSAKIVMLKPEFTDKAPTVYNFKSGATTVRIIAMSTELANRTWFPEVGGKQYVITGPEYLGDISIKNNQLQLSTEYFWVQDKQYPVWVFSEGSTKTINVKSTPVKHTEEIALSNWQTKDASATNADYDDSKWLKSNIAEQMGADGDLSSYAWYRTNISVANAGSYILKVKNGGDRASIYIDGKHVVTAKVPGNITLPDLKQGRHTLAIFTAHDGRNKLYDYYGAVQYKDAKGLSGEILLQKDKNATLTDWKMLDAADKDAVKNGVPAFENAVSYKLGDDAFDKKRGYKWFQTIITAENGNVPRSLYLRGIPAGSVVFVNDKKFEKPEDGAPGFSIPLNGVFNPSNKNTLTIFVENTRGGRKGGLNAAPEVVVEHKDDIALNNWRMKGGPGDDQSLAGWSVLQSNANYDRPQFYKTSFVIPPMSTNIHAMWRVTFEGLGHGSIWVNGHNLGRYPEKIPVKSLYIPEVWLNKGSNSLVVYDEDGNKPDKIKIIAEKAASRDAEIVKL
ncbi:MAG TPA: beta-galactosidase [Mucilaginibacter sp.]|nr:beta-galactosidase [Mucilaginibacter sp.]